MKSILQSALKGLKIRLFVSSIIEATYFLREMVAFFCAL